MNAATRPIPIGSNSSHRDSPVPRSLTHESPMVSHSLPADMHHIHLSRFLATANGVRSGGVQPPRAPVVGSMPDPDCFQLESLPAFSLGPSAETMEEESIPQRAPAVLQFSSSCPGNIGFLRSNPTWTPTLEPPSVEPDDLDLSKSPALAAMSMMRQRMRRDGGCGHEGTTQQMDSGPTHRSGSIRTHPTRHLYASNEASSYTVSAEMMERLRITADKGETDTEEARNERCRVPGYSLPMPGDLRRQRATERRRSCGNGSDTGDTGDTRDTGIFEFDDQ
ncbi:hypothetical protein PsorP6_007012 [Peronosclerospora sorghi]|uniref:Uncharacterized protein n=1 Tax=Peronosclerospora sorghi TaxID=230839 RepID=A0ACC0WD84_9STRA|nr:hypothetical protein PsorP6_007012 [Peronosclerospora sorghi]